MIFPNSVPSQFQTEKKKKEKKDQMLIKRNKAAMTLNQRFPGYLKALEQDELVASHDVSRIRQLIKDCKRQDTLPIDFMQYKDIFKQYFEFRHLTSDTALKVCDFLCI